MKQKAIWVRSWAVTQTGHCSLNDECVVSQLKGSVLPPKGREVWPLSHSQCVKWIRPNHKGCPEVAYQKGSALTTSPPCKQTRANQTEVSPIKTPSGMPGSTFSLWSSPGDCPSWFNWDCCSGQTTFIHVHDYTGCSSIIFSRISTFAWLLGQMHPLYWHEIKRNFDFLEKGPHRLSILCM